MHRPGSAFNTIMQRLRQRQPSETIILLGLAIMVGLVTGAGVWLFRRGIELFDSLFRVWLAQDVLGRWLGPAAAIVALVLAGAIVGWMVQHLLEEEPTHGVAGIMESVALAGGRLRYGMAPAKALIAAISLGAGASLGPEDPSVQIGANLGSFLGQRLRLSEDRLRVLVAAGTASAVAAAFKAPIAGVFFALEVILGEFTTASVGVVVLAAVMSSAFMQAVELDRPELGALSHSIGSPVEIPLFIPLGLVLVPFAVLFIRTVYWQQDLWRRLERIPRPLRTALAGALVGAVGLALPEILGPGREPMRAVLSGESQATLTMLLALGIGKLVMTAVSLAGGFRGGVFAPSLFIGTMVGGGFGRIAASMFGTSLVSSTEAYAIAGMAGMMAGVLRAPITAILLVFELTNDYRLILPIMLTTVVSTFVTDRIEPHSIYALGLWRRGIRLKQGRDIDVMQGILARDVMHSPAPTINEQASLAELRDALRTHHTRSLCVVDGDGMLGGIVTLADLQKAYASQTGSAQLTVGEVCSRAVITAVPDETLDVVIRKMGTQDVMSLPVIRPRTRELVGMIARRDVMRAYQFAITQKQQDQHRVEQIRLNTLTGAHVYEMHVQQGGLAGRAIRDIALPAECIIASIERQGRLIVPNGSTVLRPGDRVTIVAAPDLADELAALFGNSKTGGQRDGVSR